MIILWAAGILDSILEKNTPLIVGKLVQSSKRGFSILFLLQRVLLFLYRRFNTVYLFLPEVCDSLF